MNSPKSTLRGRWALLLGALIVAGCDGVATIPPSTTVAGLVLSEDLAEGTVSLRDSSTPPLERSTVIRSNGAYAIDITGLVAPFVLQAQVTTGAGSEQLYTIPGDEIATNLSTLSTTAVAALTQSGFPQECFEHHGHEWATSFKILRVIAQLRTVLKPLFDLYQVPADPFGDDGMDAALRALLRDVSITVHHGEVTVTNRATGGVIFQGPLSDLASGTFHPENLPPGPGSSQPPSTDGAALYAATCAKCHGALPGDVGGASASDIRRAIAWNRGGMRKLIRMTDAQIAAIAAALSGTNPPTTCTSFTYSAWGECQPAGLQSRTVVSASPGGCTGGSPILSQSCSYVPPVTTCTSFTYTDWGACQPDGTQTRTVTSSSPAGCTGGSAVVSQTCSYVPPANTCTSFEYTAWSDCQPDGTQTRTVISSSPAGCTGGIAVVSRSCTYVPPANTCTSFEYTAWSTCSNGTQTRTVVSSSPAGCTGGIPVLSQTCQ